MDPFYKQIKRLQCELHLCGPLHFHVELVIVLLKGSDPYPSPYTVWAVCGRWSVVAVVQGEMEIASHVGLFFRAWAVLYLAARQMQGTTYHCLLILNLHCMYLYPHVSQSCIRHTVSWYPSFYKPCDFTSQVCLFNVIVF